MAVQIEPLSFVRDECPNLWALLNKRAKVRLPTGLEDFLSGGLAHQGRSLLLRADTHVSRLFARTSCKIVGDTYRRDISGLSSEDRLAELLCEIALASSLAAISIVPPVLRPKTDWGTECDVKVSVADHELYGEAKRLADRWSGISRSIRKSPRESEPSGAVRPRSMDLLSKLRDVYRQFPQAALNVLFLFHPSPRVPGNTHAYVTQALFGDQAAFDNVASPSLHDDGLFSLPNWREISACAHTQVNEDGALSFVRIWQNPNARVTLPADVSRALTLAD